MEERGGLQGSSLAQVIVATFAEIQIGSVTMNRVADDTYFFGSLEELAAAWAPVESVLQAHGNVVHLGK